METTNAALMQAEFEEVWEVSVGKEVFTINDKQMELLKEATLKGQRGMIWFDRFAISIPHIQSVYRIGKRPVNNEQKPIRWDCDAKTGVARPIYE